MPAAIAPVSVMIALPDEEATLRLGRDLSQLLRPGDMLALSGGLGAGKTTLARALILTCLAANGRTEDVPSPTFTLVQTYESPGLLLTHVDLYRIDDESELAELGLGDALDGGALLIEWPDKAPQALNRLHATRLDIELAIMGEGRREARLQTANADWIARLRHWGRS